MVVEHILLTFGVILGAGLFAQLIATFLRIPEMIVLVAVGAVIGPSVLGLVSNPLDGVGAQLLFNIGVALILFHGDVGIALRVISRTAVGLGLLVLPGVFITAFIVALVVAPIFGVSLLVAFMTARCSHPPIRPSSSPSSRSSVCGRRYLRRLSPSRPLTT